MKHKLLNMKFDLQLNNNIKKSTNIVPFFLESWEKYEK